jgi:hypothetical protein
MASLARINVPLCAQGDFPKLMILDGPPVHAESRSHARGFSYMQSLAESLDDFNNPFFGLEQDVFQKFLDGIKGDDVSIRDGPPSLSCRASGSEHDLHSESNSVFSDRLFSMGGSLA